MIEVVLNSNELIVIALGGNALLQSGQKGSFEEQSANFQAAAIKIVDLIQKGYRVAITHGNGPQVGYILLKNEIAKKYAPPFPIDACGAQTQGWIGYMIQQSLQNLLNARALKKEVITLVTRVIVDEKDPAFQNPSKPIGPFYTKDDLDSLTKEQPNWKIKEDAGRGYRRVVPSPEPREILERQAIRAMVDAGFIVIACGGGGIPVVERNGVVMGIDAVIDKDLQSEKLATLINASRLIILTDVDYAFINYGKPDKKALERIKIDQAKELYDQSHFKGGSMGPKFLAAIRFVENGGKEAIIGNLNKLHDCIEGYSGTHILPQ